MWSSARWEDATAAHELRQTLLIPISCLELSKGAASAPEISLDISQYLMHAQKRNRERVEAVRERRRRALAVAKKAADLLRTEFSFEKVVLFGSTVEEELFHLRADVDLAVWGLSGNLYFKVVGQLQALDP